MDRAQRLVPRVVVTACAIGSAAGAELEAQFHYGVDLGFQSRYEWRGLRLHDGAVLQPNLFAGVGEDWRITAGVFATYELASVGPRDIGFGTPWYQAGETNAWAEAGIPMGGLDLGLGWVYRWYDTDDAVGPPATLENTHELFGRVRLISLPVIVPEVVAWYDVDRVKGAYVEGRLDIRIPFFVQVGIPLGSMYLTPRIGLNLGQEVDPAAGEPGYFAADGITHWGVSLGLPTYGPDGVGPFGLSLQLAFHFERKIDELTKAFQGGRIDHNRVWFSATVSLLGPRCRPARELCPGAL